MDMVDVTVTVINEDDDGMVTLSTMRPSIGTEITATLTDPDMMVTGTTWQWSRSMTTGGTFTPITGATSAMYTTVEADDDGYYLRATASYTDGHGSGKSAMGTTASMVTAGDPLVVEYDDNKNGMIDRSEAIDVLLRYLADPTDVSRSEAIAVLLLYLGS